MTLEEFLNEIAELLGETVAKKLKKYFQDYPEYGDLAALHIPILAKLTAEELKLWSQMVIQGQQQGAELVLLRQSTPEERHNYRQEIKTRLVKLNFHYQDMHDAQEVFLGDLLQALLRTLIALLTK